MSEELAEFLGAAFTITLLIAVAWAALVMF